MGRNSVITCCLGVALIGGSLNLQAAPASPNAKALFDWNSGENTSMTGWTWSEDLVYGNPGWILDPDGPLFGGQTFSWGAGPRSFNKGDYGKDNTANIETSVRAPSTTTGGSLIVTETQQSTDHRSSWWLLYDGIPLSERGVTDENTDRMSFYLKTEGVSPLNDDGGKGSITNNFHIGTYLCWDPGSPTYGSGDGCPYEGPGNQHYYHYLAVNNGGWVHVLLDQHPQHRRGEGAPENNPALASDGKNYFEHIHQFYMEIRYPQAQKTNYRIDELEYYSTKDTVEPNQNDISISSLWVGYWPATDSWEVGFHDRSYTSYNDDSNSTYDIRWSTSPITNANFENATPISPMFYGGPEHAGEGGDTLIRRSDAWTSNAWTRFKIPDDTEAANSQMYFAIKDVSVAGGHVGTKWPWNKGDGHSAQSNHIKVIDYYLDTSSDPDAQSSPESPTNVSIK